MLWECIMNLTFEQITNIAKGHLGSDVIDGKLRLRRFTDKQIGFYTNGHKFADRMFNCAGMTFDFLTDADTMRITFSYAMKSTTYPVKMDVYVDGTMISYYDIDSRPNVTEVYDVDLKSKDKKRVTVYLPYSCDILFHSVELSDGAYAEPYTAYTKNVLILGDSITHGWYANFSSLSYASIITRRFGWNALNQAVSGFWFSGEWLDAELPFKPELITVAYGTNDWYKGEGREKYSATVHDFYTELRRIYPDTPVVALLPIWRGENDEKPCTKKEIAEITREIAESYGAHVVDAYPFVPHLPDFFGEGRLHPNDLGFATYADGVAKALIELGFEK